MPEASVPVFFPCTNCDGTGRIEATGNVRSTSGEGLRCPKCQGEKGQERWTPLSELAALLFTDRK
jgi:hypothetical protein